MEVGKAGNARHVCIWPGKKGYWIKKCLRFTRFVDHMLNENSRDCEYWQPAHGLMASQIGYGSGEENHTDKIES